MQIKRHRSSNNNEFLNNWPIFIKFGIRVMLRTNDHRKFAFFNLSKVEKKETRH
jgi:hypothetical protein